MSTIFDQLREEATNPSGQFAELLRSVIQKRLQAANYGDGTGTGTASPNRYDYMSNGGPVNRSRFFDKPQREFVGYGNGDSNGYSTTRERFAADMRGNLVAPPYNGMRADSMMDQASYARHPDAAEAIRNTVTGTRAIAPPTEESDSFPSLRALLNVFTGNK